MKSKPTTTIEILESRIAPATLVGLTNKDILVSFDSAAPERILSAVQIAGLAPGENIVSLDARPANGLIYGLTNLNTLYTLNPYSGAASLVMAGVAAFPLVGKNVGIDFNPAVDRLRVVSDAELNFRFNPTTGAIVDGDAGAPDTQPDTALAYDAADVNQTKNPAVNAVAYDRNFQGTTQTTLFGIDSARNTLVRVGSENGTPNSPNGGVLTTIGALGVNPGARVGFDIAADGTAYAAMQVAGKTSLFTVDLITGTATPVGKIGKGTLKLDAITTLPHEEIVVGVTTGNLLVSFRASDPGTMLSATPLTGLAMGETIRGIDFRPLTGELIALTSLNQVISINRSTGQTIDRGALLDGATFFSSASDSGFDFNPSVDRLRLVNADNDNARFNPVTFAPVQADTDVAYIATDVNVGVDPNITGVAYDRNDTDAMTTTTLFGIDSTLNNLVRQGAVDGNAADVAGGGSPNGGLLTTLGSLGVNPTDLVGFDISDNGRNGVGVALAAMQLQGEAVSKLFAINLTPGLSNQALGTATLIGTIGAGDALTAMAIAPATIQFSVAKTFVKEKAGTFAVIEITRTGGANIASSITFNTSDGTASAGADYTAVTSQVISFAIGETLQRVMIPILGDKLAEFDETILFQLTAPTGGTTILGSTIDAIATILGKKLAE